MVTNKDIKVYSTHQGKYINSISKNVYLDKLADIVNETVMHNIEPLKLNLLMYSQAYVLILIQKKRILSLKLGIM